MTVNAIGSVYQRLGVDFIQKMNIGSRTNYLINQLRNSSKKITSNTAKEIESLKIETGAVQKFAASEKFGAFKKIGLSIAAIGVLKKPLSKLDIEATKQEKIKPEEKLKSYAFKSILEKYQNLSAATSLAKGRMTPERQISLTPTLESLQILNKYVKVTDGENSPRWDRKELTPDELEKSFVFKQPQSPYKSWE
ncbi:hypothetical protein SC206_12305 [Rouxiella sp. T17]|uniref:hypothetical protein n=1 Tax=Rouxiella sp. T17 TaxID=3085684 RepID=UPI002FC9B05B